jgi:hypothetical protein
MRKCLLRVGWIEYWNQLGKYIPTREQIVFGLLNCWKCFHLLYSQNRYIFNRRALPPCLQRTLYSTCNFKVISIKHSRRRPSVLSVRAKMVFFLMILCRVVEFYQKTKGFLFPVKIKFPFFTNLFSILFRSSDALKQQYWEVLILTTPTKI